jgi:sec-independent protein translocase protein TatB
MFGIGLPEMIVIFAVALIVIGPDKLPGMARSMAKGLMDLKKTLHQVKEELTKDGEPLNTVQDDLRKTAAELRGKMIDVDPSVWQPDPQPGSPQKDLIIDLEPEARAIEAELRTEEQYAATAPSPETTTPPDAESQPAATSSAKQPTPAQPTQQ